VIEKSFKSVMNLDEFKNSAYEFIDWIVEYYKNIEAIKSIAYDFFIDQIIVLEITAGKKEEAPPSLKVSIKYHSPTINGIGYGRSLDFTGANMGMQIDDLLSGIKTVVKDDYDASGSADFDQKVTDMRTGKQVSLSTYKGKAVLFFIYPLYVDGFFLSFDYPEVKSRFSALKQKYPDLAIIVGLNKKCDPLVLSEILKDKEFPYPILDLKDYGEKFFQQTNSSYSSYFVGVDGNVKSGFFLSSSELNIYTKLKNAVPENKKNAIRKTLTEAARDNDLQAVNQLVNEGVRTIVSEDNHNALEWAIHYENNAMWDTLINRTTLGDAELLHAAFVSVTEKKDVYLQSILLKLTDTHVQRIKLLYEEAETCGNSNALSCLNKRFPDLLPFIQSGFDYRQMLSKGMNPGIDPAFPFPVSGQRFNSKACELFAMKHILNYKYKENNDVDNWEKMMNKGHYDSWGQVTDIQVLMKKIGLEYGSYKADIGLLFYYLCKGEPVISEREFGNDQHSHSVAAYSFDEKGVWLSDSANGKRWNIDYDTFFHNRWFTVRVIRKIDIRSDK